MIGLWGFLEETSFAVFPLLLLLITILAIRRTPRGDGRFSLKGIAVLLVIVALPAVFGWRFAREVETRLFLSSLTTEDVESVSIGARQVTDAGKKSILIHALREIEWFSPHHGGWAQALDFRIKLKSGQDRYFRIATYLREPGVVIDFAVPRDRGGLHAGYAFSRTLPNALTEIGIDLPR